MKIFVHYLPEPGTKIRANERSKRKSERKSGYSGNQNQVQFTCYRCQDEKINSMLGCSFWLFFATLENLHFQTWTNMTDKLPLLSRNNKSDSAMRSPDSIEKRIDDGKSAVVSCSLKLKLTRSGSRFDGRG